MSTTGIEVAGEQNLATEVSADEIASEQPKTKIGDKPTTVDGVTVDKKPRLQMPRGTQTFRIHAGVDPNKYVGQRGHVIRAMQALAAERGADEFFEIGEIDGRVENLVSRTPHIDSVTYHLKGLASEQLADVKLKETPVPTPAPAQIPATT